MALFGNRKYLQIGGEPFVRTANVEIFPNEVRAREAYDGGYYVQGSYRGVGGVITPGVYNKQEAINLARKFAREKNVRYASIHNIE